MTGIKTTVPMAAGVPGRGLQRRRVLAGLVAAGLGGCASVVPREFTTSERELQAALSARFPLQQKVLEVFEVQVTTPRVLLQPAAGRLMLGFDLGLRETVLSRRDFRGSIMFSSALRYEPSDGTIRLDRVRRENLAIDGLPAMLVSGLNRWGGWLAETWLENMEIHRIDRLALDLAAKAGLQPGPIEVRSSGVTLKLVPLPASGNMAPARS